MSNRIITVHTTPNCIQCRLTKDALNKAQAEYITINIKEHPAAAEYVRSLGHLTAPVVTVTDETDALIESWSGFQPEKIKAYTRHTARREYA